MLLFPTGKQPKFIMDLKDIIDAPKEISLQVSQTGQHSCNK